MLFLTIFCHIIVWSFIRVFTFNFSSTFLILFSDVPIIETFYFILTDCLMYDVTVEHLDQCHEILQ